MYIAISQVMSEAWMANKEVWRAVEYPCGDHADICKIHKCGDEVELMELMSVEGTQNNS